MNDNVYYTRSQFESSNWWLLPAILLSLFLGKLIAGSGMTLGMMLTVIPFVAGMLVLVFLQPRIGFIISIIYCFFTPALTRFLPGPQYGLGQDGMLLLTWFGIIFHRSHKYKLRHLNNDLVWMSVAWFILTVLEIANPEKPSIDGWFYEMRSSTLYWVLSVPLAFLVFNKKSDLDLFLKIIITISVAGALYGMKQKTFGTNGAEDAWLEAGARKTHILFGKLRIFSFYAEAGQFGASQAHLSILCIILATGPHGRRWKFIYLVLGFLLFYSMLISGTRGALFALVGGGFAFLVLSKNVRVLAIGGCIGLMFLGVLKYTSIGSGNAEIVRLRTSLNPEDASLMVRLDNQRILSEYLSSRPFGGGVGVIGMWGVKYNSDKFLSTIPPDSLFVKNWAMYGIIGFLIWFGIMFYTIGKCAGIIWNTRDQVMRNKMSALLSGTVGILLCSYGNEVMNQMPSSIICYVSWAVIWMSPRWDIPWDTPLHKEVVPIEKQEYSLAL